MKTEEEIVAALALKSDADLWAWREYFVLCIELGKSEINNRTRCLLLIADELTKRRIEIFGKAE